MKRCFILAILFILSIPGRSSAFLHSSDPENIFSILAQAPGIFRVKLLELQSPTAKQRYFIQELKVEEKIYGATSDSKIKVFQEMILPSDRSAFPENKSLLVALAELPSYTSYAPARAQGAPYRLFGGNRAVVVLNEEGSELLEWSRKLAEVRGASGNLSAVALKSLLLEALDMKSPSFLNEAALALGAMPENFFSAEEVGKIAAQLQDVRLKSSAQIALIQALKKSRTGSALEALKKLADGPSSNVKWAAVRALEDLGHKRSTVSLKADFQASDEAGKLKALGAVVRQRDAQTGAFLREVLNGSEAVSVKREAIASMARIGGEEYEALLIGQIENPDPEVASQAMLALGRMQSRAAVPKLLEWIDSPSPSLRSAAIMGLRQSNDPRAQEVLREKFPEGGMGHSH